MAKEMKSKYKVIGVMAGSSMDGLDVAEVILTKREKWSFEVGKCQTIPYPEAVISELQTAAEKEELELQALDLKFGQWVGEQLFEFGTNDCDLVAVHGHTVIHDPENRISWQLGRADIIALKADIPVVSEFRSLDVSLGGQGAPLVPMGDFELFDEFDACLNLGGIANVSIKAEKIAWDVCPCNQILNEFSKKMGCEYDEGGNLAREGLVDHDWYERVSQIPFFSEAAPKSLPNAFISQELLNGIAPKNGLRTYTRFMSDLIVSDLGKHLSPDSRILVAGGGAYNTYLMELLNDNDSGLVFHVPDQTIVEFKEAIVFGFLGVLSWRNDTNVLASVTGASRDTSSGEIHYPK